MRLLLINTCGAEGVIALAEDAAVVATEILPGRSSSENLLPAVRRLMSEGGWRVGELGAVAVVIGPGSFTGVRVGLSAAKGLCEAGGVGMIAMSRLALVAAALGDAGDAIALLDAGRGEYFCGFDDNQGGFTEWLLRTDDEVQELRHGRRSVTCEARVAERLGGEMLVTTEPGPAELLAMALRRIEAGEWSDVASVDANYLRRTDAEILVHGR